MPEELALPAVHARIRREFASTLKHVAEGTTAFWVGSAISRNRVPNLEEALRAVLNFLRDSATLFEAGDAHYDALLGILGEHMATQAKRLRTQGRAWKVPKDLSTLVSRYSEILSVRVGEEPLDYLTWNGLDVPRTYGDPDLEPDTEHRLIAALVVEGVLTEIVTANWDGLIEKAVAEAAVGSAPLAVRLGNDSFREPRPNSLLYKIHGCAVRASADESMRPYLVARAADVTGWPQERFAEMNSAAVTLAKQYRTVLVGLSAQDSNIQKVFRTAASARRWQWDPADVACLVTTTELSPTQADLLEQIYPDLYAERYREIDPASLSGAYAAPSLVVFLIEVIRTKASALIPGGALGTASREGIGWLVDALTSSDKATADKVLAWITTGLSPMVAIHHGIEIQRPQYVPIVKGKLADAVPTPATRMETALATALGMALAAASAGGWELDTEESTIGEGTLALQDQDGQRRHVLFVDATSRSDDLARTTAAWQDPEQPVIILHTSGRSGSRPRRGPASELGAGRRGELSAEVWLEEAIERAVDGQHVASLRAELSL